MINYVRMYVDSKKKKHNNNFLKSKFVTKTETLKLAFNHKKDKGNIRGNIVILCYTVFRQTLLLRKSQ